MRASLLLLLTLGCSRGFDPPSTFVGKSEETATVEVDGAPGAKPGSWKTSRKADDVVVKVEREGKRRLRIQVDGCTMLVEQTASDEQVAATVNTPPQVCDIEIDHYKGPIGVFGTFAFDKQRGTLKLNISAAPPPYGSKTRVTYMKFYDGVAKQ